MWFGVAMQQAMEWIMRIRSFLPGRAEAAATVL
jgi:hypothetical protein